MTRYAVRLVLATPEPVPVAKADALIDLLTPDGGERASVHWQGEHPRRLVVAWARRLAPSPVPALWAEAAR